MKKQILGGCALVVAAGVVACHFTADTHAGRKRRQKSTQATSVQPLDAGVAGTGAPDVIVGSVNGVSNWASEIGPDGRTAYSFGTTSCNIGTAPLKWIDENNSDQYPVIGQNMYRLTEGGRFEQIGMGWLKHAFCALQGGLCGACDSYCGGCCDHLGVGCSDPYSSGLNGSQSQLGPRHPVNAHTGEHPPNPQSGSVSDAFERRVVVRNADLDEPNALFFIEGQYVTQDDAQAGNGNNNVSYRQVEVDPQDDYDLSMIGGTVQEVPAIQAWQYQDPTVTLVDIDVPELGPGTGRMILGYKVIDNENGTWTYEYALYNMNSDRSARSFHVPVDLGTTTSSVGFHDIDYHSGEIWDNTDWTTDGVSGGALTWSTDDYETNPLANALRWGTIYNFRFTASTPPVPAQIEVGFFKPADVEDAGSILVDAMGPDIGKPDTCPADLNDDGHVDVQDLILILINYGTSDPAGDANGDGEVGVQDILDVIIAFGVCEEGV
jgi:hypothetical protein